MSFEFNKNIVCAIFNTEKSTELKEKQKIVTFWIKNSVTKEDIKKEVEKVFNVAVERVNITRLTKIGRMFKGKRGKSKEIKKAYVKISKDSDFDFSKLQQ